MNLLKIVGNRTYAVGLAMIVYGLLAMFDQIEVSPEIMTMLGGGGLMTLRAGIPQGEVVDEEGKIALRHLLLVIAAVAVLSFVIVWILGAV